MKGTGAGGHSPRHDKLLDKDELKVDLDSTFGHHGTYLRLITLNISLCPIFLSLVLKLSLRSLLNRYYKFYTINLYLRYR